MGIMSFEEAVGKIPLNTVKWQWRKGSCIKADPKKSAAWLLKHTPDNKKIRADNILEEALADRTCPFRDYITAKDRTALTEVRLIRTAEIIRALELRIAPDNRVRALNLIPDPVKDRTDERGTFTWIGVVKANSTYEDCLMEQCYVDLKAFIVKYRCLEKYFGRSYKALTAMLAVLGKHIGKRRAKRGEKPLPEFDPP